MAVSEEKEIMVLAKMGNPAGLLKAQKVELHLQYEYKDPRNDGKKLKVRTRMTQYLQTGIDGVYMAKAIAKFEETIKSKVGKEDGVARNIEATSPILPEYFNVWRKSFAEKGQLKLRFTFVTQAVKLRVGSQLCNIPELKYEVDVFFNQDLKLSGYCKIDIELQDVIKHIKENHPEITEFEFKPTFEDLPLELTDVIDPRYGDDQYKKIGEFFSIFEVSNDIDPDKIVFPMVFNHASEG